MNIKGVAFDLEGVIINIEYAHHQGHILAAADVGVILTFDDCLQKLPHFIGGPDTKVAEEIASLADGADSEYVLNRKRHHYDVLLKTLPIELRPGIIDVFNWIKDNNLKMAIGSAAIMAQAAVLLEKTGLYGIFDKSNILLREDVRHIKPDPEIWLKTAERMKIKPQEQLVFEDSPFGIVAAKAAGSIAVGMPVIHEPSVIENLIDAGAARIFWDWREMNFPWLIRNLSETLEF